MSCDLCDVDNCFTQTVLIQHQFDGKIIPNIETACVHHYGLSQYTISTIIHYSVSHVGTASWPAIFLWIIGYVTIWRLMQSLTEWSNSSPFIITL